MLPHGVVAGTVLANKYRLTACLGKGGMGQVWSAEDMRLGVSVALKVIDATLLEADESRQEVVARFLREAQAAAELRSPHVVQILEFGVEAGVPFIAMELLVGETLAARLLRLRILPYADTARILAHIGRAMARAHEAGIVHRDLKPENVILTKNDDEELAKVMDFGIAKRTSGAMADGGAGVTRSGFVVGTPAYMSPEQTVGTTPIDGRSDLWSMAIIAYECVVGRRPFEAATQGEMTLRVCAYPMPVPSKFARVPPGFDAWFARAADRDPSKRFATARDLVEALRTVLLQPGLAAPELPPRTAGGPADTERGLTTTHIQAAAPRRARRLMVLGLTLGLVSGGAVFAAIVVRHGGRESDVTARAVSATPSAESALASAVVAPPTATAVVAPSATASAGASASESSAPVEPSASAHPTARASTPRPPRVPVGNAPSKDPRLGF